MSPVPNSESSDTGAPKDVGDAFLDFIEDRYSEWEREFGDEVDARRTPSFDPTK